MIGDCFQAGNFSAVRAEHQVGLPEDPLLHPMAELWSAGGLAVEHGEGGTGRVASGANVGVEKEHLAAVQAAAVPGKGTGTRRVRHGGEV